MADRSRRRATRMTMEEAETVLDRADAGQLDTDDPRIARIVGQAHQRVSRARIWGGDHTRGRAVRYLVAAIVFLSISIAALVAPLLAAVR